MVASVGQKRSDVQVLHEGPGTVIWKGLSVPHLNSWEFHGPWAGDAQMTGYALS